MVGWRMVRRIHDHHGPGGRISDCDCQNPSAPVLRTFLPGPGEGAGLPGVPWVPLAGSGIPRDARPLVRIKPQHIAPCALLVGVAGYAITAALVWWLAVPLLSVLLVALVHGVGEDWVGIAPPDRQPLARLLR